MVFNDFEEKVTYAVKEKLGDDLEISSRKVCKNNGVIYTGIMAGTFERSVCPTVYIDGYYREDMEDKDIEDVADRISNILKASVIEKSRDLESIFEYDNIRDRIAFKLINTAMNKELLDDVPHRDFLDLSICYYFDIKDGLVSSGQISGGTVVIHYSLMKKWNVTEDELYDIALKNMRDSHGDNIRSMIDLIKDRLPDENMDFDPEMYVLSNSKNLFGASALIYSDLIKDLSDEKESDIFILPSSIHELILLPKNDLIPGSELHNMVSEVNETELDPQDILSDSVYIYEKNSGTVRLASERDEN
ncbi:MAG: DUF5688 family protein [Lachnospiraceae bacterium]|nr:DUF5688 family protein [Lachnospiraceae bacterium]